MISQSEFDEFKNFVAEVSVEDVEIIQTTETPDGRGGFTDTPAVVATVKGWISPLGNSSSERALADRLQDENLATITLPVGTVVENGYQLRVDGRMFEVVGVPPPPTIEVRRKVMCKEVK